MPARTPSGSDSSWQPSRRRAAPAPGIAMRHSGVVILNHKQEEPPTQAIHVKWLEPRRLQTSIRRHQFLEAPKWGIRAQEYW